MNREDTIRRLIMEGNREDKTIGVFMLKGKSIKEIVEILPDPDVLRDYWFWEYSKLRTKGDLYYEVSPRLYAFIGSTGLIIRNIGINKDYKIENIWNQQ